MAGRQCEKRLWLEVYRPDLIEYGSDVEQRFAAGEDVNDVARAQYPDGVLVSYDCGANAAVEHTQRLLAEQPGTPIFAYGSYEKTVLNALIARYSDLAEDLHKLKERLVDLLSIARKTYYHPDMLGSWSIKNVLPTMAPHLGYGSLGDVQDGSAAGTAYLQIINPETDAAERERLTRELLAYCKHDTLGMVALVKYLSKGSG